MCIGSGVEPICDAGRKRWSFSVRSNGMSWWPSATMPNGGMTVEAVMSLQALYTQNSQISLLINTTVPSMAFQQTKDCTHIDTTFILRQLLFMCFVIHPILLHIRIAIFHHGKAPMIDNHPKTELPHHSEAPSWRAHSSLMKMMWLMWVPSQLW